MNLLLWTTHLERAHRELLGQIRQWGYDGVEVPLFSLDQTDAAWIAREVAQGGLGVTTVTCLPPEANLVGEGERERRAGIDHLRRSIELTREMGAKLLCGPVYSPVGRLLGRGRSREEWQRAVASFRQVAGIAERNGVRLAIEPLNRFETYVLNLAADAAELIDEVGTAGLGILLDVFHANIEEKSLAGALRACGPHLAHIHVSDNDRGICGSGHVPWDDLFSGLQEASYNGWIVVESFSQSLPEIAAATAIWRPLAASNEVFARESLAFLRGKVAARTRQN